MKKKLLLHICCATCAAYVFQKLSADYQVTVFYYNPNIYPKEEYLKRFLEAQDFFVKNDIPFVEENPDQDRWFLLIKGHENDPEKGERCTVCYKMRLEKTAAYAAEHGYDYFGTDLSISPHKDAPRLNKLGQELAKQYGIKYLTADFKKDDGFKKAMTISKREGFYRQNYCGCIYSLKERQKSQDK